MDNQVSKGMVEQEDKETRRQGDKESSALPISLSPHLPISLSPYLLLAPALAVILLLFGGGLLLALLQSVGYVPAIGRTEFSLEAYHNIFTDPAFGRSLLLTLWIAGVSTAVSTILALIAALTLRRTFRGKRIATFIFQSNLPIPHLVGAIAILLLFSQSGFLARLGHLAGLIQVPADFPALVFRPVCHWHHSGIRLEKQRVYQRHFAGLAAIHWRRVRKCGANIREPTAGSASAM